MKATATAPSNIAFIKYWGKKDGGLNIPENGSISMNLNNLQTVTTVAFDSSYCEDSIIIDGKRGELNGEKVSRHLDRIRKMAQTAMYAKVVSANTFPMGTGLSSSASGFAALTVAATAALGLKLSEKQLSILARLGSGSSCRSIPDGFVEWFPGTSSDTSFAASLYPSSYWDIVDVVAVVSQAEKQVSSSKGHMLARTSPFFAGRIGSIDQKISALKKYLQEKDFTKLGETIEKEALELHAIYLTSLPSLIYLLPETLIVITQIKKWREAGLAVYFSLNTGQDIHVLCRQQDARKVVALLSKISVVKRTIINKPAKGARVTGKHLF